MFTLPSAPQPFPIPTVYIVFILSLNFNPMTPSASLLIAFLWSISSAPSSLPFSSYLKPCVYALSTWKLAPVPSHCAPLSSHPQPFPDHPV